VISLKKYLDMDFSTPSSQEPEQEGMQSAIFGAYRSVILAIAKSGARVCPAAGLELQQNLEGLEKKLSANPTDSAVQETGKKVEEQLQQWCNRTSNHLKEKANEVKELLLVLARTAESVGERDQRYSNQFSDFTTRLKTIADLDDLTQIRASLVRGASELKNCIDQMAQDSRKSVVELRAEVSSYETKLKQVEELAVRDSLTGLANRRYIEERIETRIDQKQDFCVVILDLDKFKPINDTYGHAAGDNLLKQFAEELRSNVRSSDIVGRWGGDEFILILDCPLAGAKAQLERVKKWVFGDYTLQLGAGSAEVKIRVDASIGVAQWQRGDSMEKIIKQADASMYKDKQLTRAAGLA
jgi:diguanylate cyclase (GGDEF)-like protein